MQKLANVPRYRENTALVVGFSPRKDAMRKDEITPSEKTKWHNPIIIPNRTVKIKKNAYVLYSPNWRQMPIHRSEIPSFGKFLSIREVNRKSRKVVPLRKNTEENLNS